MNFRLIIGVLMFSCCGVSFAQLGGSPEKSALRNIEKHRWQKAEIKLRKTLDKDTLNPSIRYMLSVFYFDADNPAFDLDSAYRYAVTALQDYARAPTRERDRLRRISVDSIALISMRAQIDSAAFEVARRTNTEAAYLEFLSHFPSAMQRDLAAQLRDEVAYQDALNQNTHHAFLQFLNRYPQAKRAPEARAQYDRLLYFTETQDQRLSSFEKFLANYPETPYRKEIYRNIFEISTADGTVESFLTFMTRYPISDQVKKAGQMIFHILAEEDDPQWPGQFLNDSLQNLLALRSTYLVPVLKNNLYGFIDENGREIIPPVFESIHPDYLCGHITDEVLILDNKLVARNGSLIYQGMIEELSELGVGFLKVKTADDVKIIHQAGFIFQENIQDASVLGKSYIAVKKNDAWLLYTLAGRLLDENSWEDISAFGDVIFFTRDKKIYIAPREQLAKSADGNPTPLSEPFDEVKPWSNGLIWGKSGEFEGVLNQSLQRFIGFDKHILTQFFFGATAAVPNGIMLYNWKGKKSTVFEQVKVNGTWAAVKKSRSWFLMEPNLQEIKSKAYDTIRFEGPFVLGVLKDTVYVHFGPNIIATYKRPQKISFIPGKDSTSFLLMESQPQEKSVFDLKGRKLFSAAFDAIEYAGQGIFVVTRKEKKGLLNDRGEILLPAEFDAIGSVKDAVISILKNKRFGAFNIRNKMLIKPQYDRNLLPYTDMLLSTFKEGHYGFLGWDNRPLSAFEFDEIRYWDDSIAMVRKESSWSFYDITARKFTESNLRNITMIKNSPDEKIAIIQKDSNYGVISNRRNVVIPVTFSDVINLGSPEEPLYFTEKHIKEASLFIVIYYDRLGNMLRKEIYDDAADYDKIYCPDN
ncbi:MAG: WG repeat-containing protein [Cyclobacteriaceae bacterium]